MTYKAVVIDNDPQDLAQSVELLARSGAFRKIIPFSDPEEAIEYIDNYGCDVVFTEIEMKKVDGFHLGRRFGRNSLAMCFVFLTSNKNYAIEAMKLHVTDFALKPIEANVIERILRKIGKKQYFEII